MGLCAMATLSAAIHPWICAQFETRNKSQVSRSQECLECQTLYRNQTCQRMSYGVQMIVSQQKRGAEDGRRGGTASSRYAEVKLIETIQPRWRVRWTRLFADCACWENKRATQEPAGYLRVMGSELTGVCLCLQTRGRFRKLSFCQKMTCKQRSSFWRKWRSSRWAFILLLNFLQQSSLTIYYIKILWSHTHSNLFSSSCQGPDTDYNNEDLIQKSKRMFSWNKEKKLSSKEKQRSCNLESLQAKYVQLCLTEASLHKSWLDAGARAEKYGNCLVCRE